MVCVVLLLAAGRSHWLLGLVPVVGLLRLALALQLEEATDLLSVSLGYFDCLS